MNTPDENEPTDTTGETGKTTGTETQTDEPGNTTQTGIQDELGLKKTKSKS